MQSRVSCVTMLVFLAASAACGRKIDGVLYSTMDGGGKRLAAQEVVAVPANSRTRNALAQFCGEVAKRGAGSDSLRARLERRSNQLLVEASQEQARNGWSQRWKQLTSQSTAAADSARAVPLEALASSSQVAQALADARATTNANGEFHLVGVPIGKHLVVATEDDHWGDVFVVGYFRPSVVDVSTDRAMPGCVLGADFSR